MRFELVNVDEACLILDVHCHVGIFCRRQVEEDPDAEETADLAWLLYDSAMTASGFQVDDTEAFSTRVHRAMAKTLNLSSMELLEEADIPEEVCAVGAT